MTTTLEEELGTAFAARAALVPPDAAARVRAIDYRPRQHRRALPVGLGAGAAAGAATAGTVLALVLGGAAPAYAGWSAAPTTSAPPSSSPPDCLGSLATTTSGTADAGTWQTVLTDVRGPFTITLLQSGTSYATCFTGPSFTEVNRIDSPSTGSSGGTQTGVLHVSQGTDAGASASAGGVGSLVRLETTSSGDLTQVLQNHLTTASDGPYTFIDGRVANGVTGVTLVLTDGSDVVSTVADGWFVAWWPGDTADATSAQVTKPSGTTSETLVPVSGMGLKAGPGDPTSPGVTLPTSAGSCTTATTSSTSGAPSVNCKSTTGNSGAGKTASGNSGNSGPSANTGMTGSTGPGPTK